MYSPTSRLFKVLELLQSYTQMSGTEIARRLEVDGRTVRRYIVLLQDMGIPVEAERGPYGAYQLRRGYKLPPLMFSEAEAVALSLSLLAVRKFGLPVDVAAVEGALAKTERVMPAKLLLQARALQEALTFKVVPPPTQVQNSYVAILSLAAHQRKQVLLRYAAWSGEETTRAYDPYGVVFYEGYWYTAGFCHLRQDLRTFRLDRIVDLASAEPSFARPADFDVLAQVMNALARMPGTYQVEALLQTSMERARQALSPALGMLEQAEHGVIFRRAVSQLDWIANTLLKLDFPVIVLQPVELRDLIRQIAIKALRMSGDDA